jgi:hypothetical protein
MKYVFTLEFDTEEKRFNFDYKSVPEGGALMIGDVVSMLDHVARTLLNGEYEDLTPGKDQSSLN